MVLTCNSLRAMNIEIFLKVFLSPLHIFCENVLFHSIVCFLVKDNVKIAHRSSVMDVSITHHPDEKSKDKF